jgi:precorrin isomerase
MPYELSALCHALSVCKRLREHVISVATFIYIAATAQELADRGAHQLENLRNHAPELSNARFVLGNSPGAAWAICDRVRSGSGSGRAKRPWRQLQAKSSNRRVAV